MQMPGQGPKQVSFTLLGRRALLSYISQEEWEDTVEYGRPYVDVMFFKIMNLAYFRVCGFEVSVWRV